MIYMAKQERVIDTRAARYIQDALIAAGPSILPVLWDLLSKDCCPRCCMRFAGVRGKHHNSCYGHLSPSMTALRREIDARIQADDVSVRTADTPDETAGSTHGQTDSSVTSKAQCVTSGRAYPSAQPDLSQATEVEPASSSEPHSDSSVQQSSATLTGASLADDNDLPHCDPVCCLCLGVLQSLDGSVRYANQQILDAAPEPPEAGSLWQPLYEGTGSVVQLVVR